MLYVATGKKQTGKTRWLQASIEALNNKGVVCSGVITPGIWKSQSDEQAGFSYEKLGIQAVLLPENQNLLFAERVDIAQKSGRYSSEWASSKANLSWSISDEALDIINSHLLTIGTTGCQSITGLLVIDEIGPLEFKRKEGLAQALVLLKEGPKPLFQHAMIIVREQLLEQALDSFSDAWGGSHIISCDEEGRNILISAY